MMFQKTYRVGDHVMVHSVHGGYSLPDGLPERATVRVVAMSPGTRTVEHDGRRFEVAMAVLTPAGSCDTQNSGEKGKGAEVEHRAEPGH